MLGTWGTVMLLNFSARIKIPDFILALSNPGTHSLTDESHVVHESHVMCYYRYNFLVFNYMYINKYAAEKT